MNERTIRLAVHGALGRMGARIAALARDDHRFELAFELDERASNAASTPRFAPIDVVIDFSSDAGASAAATLAVRHHAALLVGTTALSAQTLSALDDAAKSIAVLVAPNTSLGVAVLNHLAGEAARLMGTPCDIDILELHHAQKKDAPSGTALRLAAGLKDRARVDLPPGRIHAIRGGDVIGEHQVHLACPGERLILTHIASSRDLFALGALRAAAWLAGRAPGRYAVEHALGIPHRA
jgi:4-hydroxy-tetrahydrodipicolinate reductase